jgi:hypothetical protein
MAFGDESDDDHDKSSEPDDVHVKGRCTFSPACPHLNSTLLNGLSLISQSPKDRPIPTTLSIPHASLLSQAKKIWHLPRQKRLSPAERLQTLLHNELAKDTKSNDKMVKGLIINRCFSRIIQTLPEYTSFPYHEYIAHQLEETAIQVSGM